MIEITDGLTSVSAGTDEIFWATGDAVARAERAARGPTGVRVTVEFQRSEALPPGSVVRVRYEFESGRWREAIGVAQPIRTVVRWGHGVLYHYRLSQWIAPDALMQYAAGSVSYRTETLENPSQHAAQQSLGPG